jgi:hypothetical protein
MPGIPVEPGMPGNPGAPGNPGVPVTGSSPGNWTPLTDTFTSTPDSLSCLPSALLLELLEEPSDCEVLALGKDGDEGEDDEDELGIEGIDGDEDDDEELGIDGMELDEDEEDVLGIDGMELDEDEEGVLGIEGAELDGDDDELGMDGIELLELELDEVVSHPASSSPSAEAVTSVLSVLGTTMLMLQSSSGAFLRCGLYAIMQSPGLPG